jgi:protein-S-isoprenylcysteine O-methyltransferase Ste14
MILFLKNLLFTLLVPGTMGVFVPLLLSRVRHPAEGPVLLFSCVLLALGGIIYAWCVWDFASYGRGTPAPIDAPKKLVVHGLYRYVRNPMYLGVLTVLLGWVVIFGGRTLTVYACCVGICFHLFVVFYEERRLRKQFGSEYVDYCMKVGRWLPRFRCPRTG